MTQVAPAFNPAAGPQWPRIIWDSDAWYVLPGTDPRTHDITGGHVGPVPMVKVQAKVPQGGRPYVVWLEADPDSDPQDACLYHKYETQ
jgi:hypothetical protein